MQISKEMNRTKKLLHSVAITIGTGSKKAPESNSIFYTLLTVFYQKMIPQWFFTPVQALNTLEQFAEESVEFKALLKEDWFPYKYLKQIKNPAPAQPIETTVCILFHFLQKAIEREGEDSSALTTPSFQPGQLIEQWHGKEAKEQYLIDLQAAGWTYDQWPPYLEQLLNEPADEQ